MRMNLSEQDILRVAAEAVCDPRTVKRYLEQNRDGVPIGDSPVRSSVAARIKRAIDSTRVRADDLTSATTRGDTGSPMNRRGA